MPKARFLLNLLFILTFTCSALAQSKDISIVLNWNKGNGDEKSQVETNAQHWFEGAFAADFQIERPQYGGVFKSDRNSDALNLALRNPIFEQIEVPAWMEMARLGSEVDLTWEDAMMRKQMHVKYTIDPYRKRADGGLERLLSATLVVESTGRSKGQTSSVDFAEHSRLAAGQWFRMGIPEDGVYRLDRAYFESLGVDVNGIDPSSINIYGNDTGQLSYANDDYDSDDLILKAIEFVGGNDGSFDNGDYILFYAKGPHRWSYDTTDEEFKHLKHANMAVAYNYIGIGVDPPSRISDAEPVTAAPNQTVTSFDELRFYERDLESVIKSGRRLVGEKFGIDRTLNFGGPTFNIQDIALDEPSKVRMRAVGETIGSSNISQVRFECQGNQEVLNLPGWAVIYVPMSSREGVVSFTPMNGNLSVQSEFTPAGSDSQAWIDFISINARRRLVKSNSQFTFRDINSVGTGNVSRFELANMTPTQVVWEVSEPSSPARIELDLVGDVASFDALTEELKEFVLFDIDNTLSPSESVSVANQDLHGTGQHDMVILTAVPFRATAEKFADFHRQEGLDVQVLEPQTIYNEFSCGMTDVTAIKMYMKMLYDRAGADVEAMPDYLMLIGDGNYDQSDINPLSSIYLPSYQSLETNSLTNSYIADDYFGLLDDGESEGGGSIDIGIGRLPVRSVEEVEGIYNKVVRYRSENTGVVGGQCNESAQTTFGDWRNKVLLVADDEDGVTHMNQADNLGDILMGVDEDYIVDKIFLDAYLQDITPGGARYPQAADELRRAMEEGMFIISYTGHGGEVGWAAERVLDVPTIQNLSNSYSLPLMLTATCEFSRYDDPGRTSAGEFTLLNPQGGVIGLFTTTRLVYSNPNYQLSQNFFDIVLRKDVTSYTCDQPGGETLDFEFPLGLRMGDIIRVSKNCTPTSYVSKANFSLLGDPALRLTYPALEIVTDSITDLAGNPIDTLKALQRVRFFGHVEQDGVLASDFSGEIAPSVYDKEATIQTLSNDNGPAFTFSLRDNIFFKGRSSVSNGEFQFEFIVPKDISYQDGNGKVFYYGISDDTDAQGSNDDFAVGGTAEDAEEDSEPPVIELFLDSESFVDGGLTNESPVLIAKIFDEFGINTVGNGIGHDITAVLDGNVSSPIVLNDYFELDLDSYQSGQVRFEFSNLSQGEHTLRFKVWDIYNNSSTKELTFNVELQSELSLDNVLNYPNPFTTRTEFLFEHNQACEALNVQVQVFTVSGKLVKTLETDVDAQKALRNQIVWDGRDDYGDKLGRGVYVYKLKVTTPEGIKQEIFEKLVLL